MNVHKVCIRNQDRMLEFLESGDAEMYDEQFFAHLEKCEVCRMHFEDAAASKDYWLEAETMLQPGEFDEASSLEITASGATLCKVDKHVAVRRIIESLAPTDDPHSLGRIGLYEVTGVIGVGGMGIVLKAFDPSLERVVAIKLLAPHFGNNTKARRRFSREARAAAAVLHPNVIPIHSVEESSDLPFLVMAYIRGGSLQSRLDQNEPLKLDEILRIGVQIAAGLSAAHEQGLVHRDIKPENILLEGDLERVTITDFGLARAVDDNTVTQLGTIAGTPQFMSPEQARGEVVDQKSDLFSFGSVLYTMCTGYPPFIAETSLGVMRKIIDESEKPIGSLNPAIPDWLIAMIQKLLAKDLSQRFESAGEVKVLLEQCLKHIQKPEEKEVPSELLNFSKCEGKKSSSLEKTQKYRALSYLAIVTIMAFIGMSWYSGMWAPFLGKSGSNLALRGVMPVRLGEKSNVSAQSDSNGRTETEVYRKLSFDLNHLPEKLVELAGVRLDALEKSKLPVVVDSFSNKELFSKWINRKNVEQILLFSLSKDDKSLITLVKTTNSTAEFLHETFGVDATSSTGQELMIRDGNVDYCVNRIDDNFFVMGSKVALEKYFESQASATGTSRLLEVVMELQDGDVFIAIDSSTIDSDYGMGTKKENSVQKTTSQFIRSLASSTQFLAVSVNYDECIKAQVSLYAVDAHLQKTIRETLVSLKNILVLSVPTNRDSGMISDQEASILLKGLKSMRVENEMNFETRLYLELDYGLIDLVYSRSGIETSVQQENR